MTSAHAQSRKELKKQKEAEELARTRELVESGSFRFDARRALPSRGRSIDLTTHSAYAEIFNEKAKADLPFFGQGRAGIGYSPESGGIVFDGQMEEVNLSVNEKKNRINMTFSVNSGRDRYRCVFTIMSNGSSTLGITSNMRSAISYDGQISALEKE
jgi:hypothetical protein